MLLKCASCNSNYLINSADIKPNGRKVRCAVCDFEWFQAPNLEQKEQLESDNLDEKIENELPYQESFKKNLPSTYIHAENPSTINSFFVILVVIFFIFIFWLLKNSDIGLIEITFYYIGEFYFNLKLIINDIASIIHKLINF